MGLLHVETVPPFSGATPVRRFSSERQGRMEEFSREIPVIIL
jgi:hypothetical protein